MEREVVTSFRTSPGDEWHQGEATHDAASAKVGARGGDDSDGVPVIGEAIQS